MNISYNWLKDYLNFDLTPEETAEALTSIGLETGGVEEVESIRGGLRGIVIGHVLTCVEHPNSDHLHITTVDLGLGGEATQIVCGAPNVAAGQTVVVATVGTTLYDGDKEFVIKKSKIRGVESFGMICAEDEIGVGTSHDGIIVITDDVKPGTPAAVYYGLTSDYVIEVDLTPNRIDAASHYGVARDLAAWLACHRTDGQLHRPGVGSFHIDRPDCPDAVSVRVDDTKACVRYAGLTIRGVKVAESPEWLRNRLTAIGQRPINNIVDITNYMLHAMGQPLHCFDVAKIKGNEIVVRTCPAGTPFTTLDGVERKLDERDLMICNAEEPMCIAGVFGGIDSGVTDSTTSIFLESACFNPTSVRKTARRHGLSTDASFRYERGCDPNGCIYILKLAALMVKELAGGEICGDIVDIYPSVVEPFKVDFDYAAANALIGKELPRETVDSILKSLEIEIAGCHDGVASLRVPTYRVDVTRQCDVIEDVLRIYGYNNVEFNDEVHSCLSYKTITDTADELRRLVSEQLTGQGFNEIMNNSLTAESFYADSEEYPIAGCVKLLNPLSSDLGVMRRTLIHGGLESLSHNINRKNSDLMMYEFGNVYHFNPAVGSTAEAPLAPFSEGARLGLWMTGDMVPANWVRPAVEATVFDLKEVVLGILSRLGLSVRELRLTQSSTESLSVCLDIATRSGKQLGRLGVVSRRLLKMHDIKQPVFFAELDWTALVSLAARRSVTFADVPRTLPVRRDLALLLDANVPMERVEAVIGESERHLLRNVELFDVYEGDKLPAGKKSYAVALTLQDNEKTLQDKQIDAVMNKIVSNLTKKLGATLR